MNIEWFEQYGGLLRDCYRDGNASWRQGEHKKECRNFRLFLLIINNALQARYQECIDPKTGYLYPVVHEFVDYWEERQRHVGRSAWLSDEIENAGEWGKFSFLSGLHGVPKQVNKSYKDEILADLATVEKADALKKIMLSNDEAQRKGDIALNDVSQVEEFLKNNKYGYYDLNNTYFDPYGTTPLMFAARLKNVALMKLIVQQGANNINTMGFNRRAALSEAILDEHRRPFFIFSDKKVEQKRMQALDLKIQAAVEYLIEQGAAVNVFTVLPRAKRALDNGSILKSDSLDTYLHTPLTEVITAGRIGWVGFPKTAQTLIEKGGADIHARLVISSDNVCSSQETLEQELKTSAESALGMTPLMLAVQCQQAEICSVLLEQHDRQNQKANYFQQEHFKKYSNEAREIAEEKYDALEIYGQYKDQLSTVWQVAHEVVERRDDKNYESNLCYQLLLQNQDRKVIKTLLLPSANDDLVKLDANNDLVADQEKEKPIVQQKSAFLSLFNFLISKKQEKEKPSAQPPDPSFCNFISSEIFEVNLIQSITELVAENKVKDIIQQQTEDEAQKEAEEKKMAEDDACRRRNVAYNS